MLSLFLSPWGCWRAPATAGQPNPKWAADIAVGGSSKRRLQVSAEAAALVVVTDSCVPHDSLEIICGQASCVYSVPFSRLEIL